MNQQDVHPAIQLLVSDHQKIDMQQERGDRVEADKGIAATANDATPR
jgi:hypothetical protein